MTKDVPSRLAALDFERDVERLTTDFTERKWVLADVDRWLKCYGQRFFILTGQPGVGKSAIAARLTQVCPDIAAYHFCIAGRNNTIVPATVLRSLAAQLGERLPDYGVALANTVKPIHLSVEVHIDIEQMTGGEVTGVIINHLYPSDPQQELDILLRAPLAALPAPDKPLVILVDSLDEAVTYRGDENLATLLVGMDDLPPWVRFICTTRPERRVLRYFDPLQPYVLAADSQPNLDDIQRYITMRVRRGRLPTRLEWASVDPQALSSYLLDLSGGNFLYTRVLLDDIEAGRQPLDDLTALPRSLDEIYHGFLRRFTVNEWTERYQLLLSVLAVAQEPLSEAQLVNFSSLPATQVRQHLGVLRQFLETPGDGAEETYTLFHQSLRDYLLDEERNCDFWCAPEEGHWSIAAYFLNSFQRNWSACDIYGFKYLVAHLQKARSWNELADLLTELDFAANKIKHLGAEALLEDMYFAYISLKEHERTDQASEICKALLKYLLSCGGVRNEELSVEEIHASLVYRPEKDFYQEFLKLGLDECSIRTLGGEHVDVAGVAMSFTARLANLKRRKGDLEEAETLLRQLVQKLDARLNEDPAFLKERAGIEYDLGYISFLRGQFGEAAETLRQSAMYASRAGDTVGEWMSRCVEYNVRFLEGLCSSEDYEQVLNQALVHFTRESQSDMPGPHSKRWIMNVHASLFEIMYYRNEVSGAVEHLAALQKDEWIGKYGGEHSLRPYLARLCILKEDWEEAIEHFRRYFDALITIRVAP